MNETQGMEDVIIIQVDSNSLSEFLNVIMDFDGNGTLNRFIIESIQP